RRRHTRFSRDWSSDVCSSDLFILKIALIILEQRNSIWITNYLFVEFILHKGLLGFEIIHRTIHQINFISFVHIKYLINLVIDKVFIDFHQIPGLLVIIISGLQLQEIVLPINCLRTIGLIYAEHFIALLLFNIYNDNPFIQFIDIDRLLLIIHT